MKRIILHFLVYMTIIGIARAGEEHKLVPLADPQLPLNLEIIHGKGNIKITGYEGEAAIIKAFYAKDDKPADLSSVIVARREHTNRVTLTSDFGQKKVNLNILVPLHTDLLVIHRAEGRVAVYHINGEITIENDFDDIRLVNVSGSAVIHSTDGAIYAEFSQVNREIPMAFSTVHGRIDVSFPADLNALLKMKTTNGEIYTDFQLQLEKRETRIEKSEKSGFMKISLDEWTYGLVNQGGPEIMLTSYHGDIFIRSRK